METQLADELDVLCECGGVMVAAIAAPNEVLWICEQCHASVNTSRRCE
jgi:hypothetical protein